jgi:hypothetical protein
VEWLVRQCLEALLLPDGSGTAEVVAHYPTHLLAQVRPKQSKCPP